MDDKSSSIQNSLIKLSPDLLIFDFNLISIISDHTCGHNWYCSENAVFTYIHVVIVDIFSKPIRS